MPTIVYSGGSATEGFNYTEWNVGMMMQIVATTFSTSRSATHVTYNQPVLGTLSAFGSFTSFDSVGDPVSGTVTGLTHNTTFGSPGGAITISISGFSIPVPTLFNWIATENGLALETALFGGADIFHGANNSERIFGYAGDDTIHGNDGDDDLVGSTGNDTLNGGAGWDTLDFGSPEGNDTLNGNAGDDIIYSAGVDTIDGGDGTDLVAISFSTPINLSTASFVSSGFTLANGTTIQNVEAFSLICGAGDDTLTMAAAGLSGSAFDGGGGMDTLISDQSALSIAQTLIPSTVFPFGEFAGYRLYGVERYVVTTGSGNDSLTGASGNDVLNSGGGNDILRGGAGTNTLNGGDGDDYIVNTGVADQIDGGNGLDAVELSRLSGATSFSIAALASGVTFADGTSLIGIERIYLTTGGGNDTFDATGLVFANGFFAGEGTDRLVYDGSALSSDLRLQWNLGGFSAGSASLTFASIEEFYFTTGLGNDELFGGDGNDVFSSGGGSDRMLGGGGNDTISGGDGNDFIGGNTGANTLSGDGGDDQITSQSAADIVDGGAGVDRVVLDRSLTAIGMTVDIATILTGTFSDGTVISNMESFELNLGSGDDTIVVSGIQGAGNIVRAGFGNGDQLIVDFSAQTTGVGAAIFDSGGRNFSLSAGGANIQVWDIERLTFSGGSATDFITGSIGDDILSGNGGNDFIDDGSSSFAVNDGRDILNGGGGNDNLTGEVADTFDGGDGIDTVWLEEGPISQVGVDYDSVAMASAAGQLLPDGGTIRNTEAVNMFAGDGNDSMRFVGLVGMNRFIGAGGVDRVTVDLSAISTAITGDVVTLSGVDFSLTFSAEYLTVFCGAGNDQLSGSFGTDVYFGNGGADSLRGFEGDDTLNGGAGNDTLHGGAGIDLAGYALLSATATWARNINGTWSVTTTDGTDTLTSVEFLDFTDRDVFLDRAAQTFSGNGTSDVLFRRNDGIIASWEVTGTSINSASFLPTAGAEWTPRGTGDISGDGRDDVIWQRNDGLVYAWLMNGGAVASAVALTGIGAEWTFLGMGDFNGDLTDDFAWRRSDGLVYTWTMNASAIQSANAVTGLGAEWALEGFGDFNSDGRDDFLWRRTDTGEMAIWQMNGASVAGGGATSAQVGLGWNVVGVGDTNCDGRHDIIMQRASDGMISVWAMDGASVLSTTDVGAANPSEWAVRDIGDYNADGRDDILWQRSDGLVYAWLLNGPSIIGAGGLSGVGSEWTIVGGG